MALLVPRYIQVANIADKSIEYMWDDGNEEQATEPIDDELLARLRGISERAIIALTSGIAEWIIYRFASLSDDPLPLQYIEAAWAMSVDLRYCGIVWDDYTHESSAWTGPIRRPLAIAVNRVEYAFQAMLEYGNPELSVGWLDNLARYLITDPTPYVNWRDQIIERLETLYPRNSGEAPGEVIPREALDPDLDFKPELTESLVNKFLASLNYKTNPFLNSPENMIKQGFTDTPYVYHIEKNRL